MQTERAGMNEAGNRKAKRWGFRWHPDRLTQSSWPIELAALAGHPGQPDQPSWSQIELGHSAHRPNCAQPARAGR